VLFSQLQFWLFFIVVLTVYVLLRHRQQNRWLLAASYVFYAAWDWRFCFLMLAVTAVSWWTGLAIERAVDDRARKQALTASLVFSLGTLAIFKYLGFFITSASAALESMGMTVSPWTLEIVLPVGISFYTFQALSYTIDVYRRQLPATRDFGDFALYIALFPQLVAGPIERATHLLPEILAPRQVTWEGLSRGGVLCLQGLIKKIVIADGVAAPVNAVYGAADPSGAAVLVATWLFAIQIYCDFSGYTDIARGVAKMLGFDLMRNFDQPYFSTNPQEFWRRWHISLSTWLRDYLYIGLGGNRGGRFKTWRNLFLTMLLGGLWHGAAWNFVLWGAYQGALLIGHRAWAGRHAGQTTSLGIWKRWLLCIAFFQVVCYGWLLFRAGSFHQIVDFTGRLLTIRLSDFSGVPMPPFAAAVGIGALLLWDLAAESRNSSRFYERWATPVRSVTWAAMIYLLAFGSTTATSAFIYFQF